MNQIKKNPVNSLGYNFIPEEHLAKGRDEYYLRKLQNNNGIQYRGLTAYEIEVLVRNRNTSDNWNNLLVSDAFSPEQVHNCKFFGLVRIGKLEPYYLEFKNLRRPVGLYNSTIISCDFGDNVVIDNVNYISHYIIGNGVIIVNVNEVATTDYARFGNGALKDGEPESLRVWLEVCNENGGRKIIPFNGMLPGDAYLWTQARDDEKLQQRFREFTLKRFDTRRGYYGVIGDRTVIKNCKILKDVNIGSDAYLKGANKLKNLTINSSADASTQIGEGCELVNGIIDYGCTVFYGVKAVRFFMASHSQLKYGARLINSYLGNNSTISCCEVLNALIFPFHEQHHNNSFLCAALLHGQTNIAAGATIGSNHNSRSPDGEIIAGRGFWPGLCVSLKHNSKFASFTIIAKGDYPAELNIPIPFSLVSNDVTHDTLTVMPGYWFMYNLYALVRNSGKYKDRDKRIIKEQLIEPGYLAPDTVNEMIQALRLLEKLTGEAWINAQGEKGAQTRQQKGVGKQGSGLVQNAARIGKRLLEHKDPLVNELSITANDFENTQRPAKLVKVLKSYHLFKKLIRFYAISLLVEYISSENIRSFKKLVDGLPDKPTRAEWQNIGGQLIRTAEIEKMRAQIRSGRIKSWDDIHQAYAQYGDNYVKERLIHAIAALREVSGIQLSRLSVEQFHQLLAESALTKKWIFNNIYESRAKDYTNPFRMMVYQNTKEMDNVIGKLDDNAFIRKEKQELNAYKKRIDRIVKELR